LHGSWPSWRQRATGSWIAGAGPESLTAAPRNSEVPVLQRSSDPGLRSHRLTMSQEAFRGPGISSPSPQPPASAAAAAAAPATASAPDSPPWWERAATAAKVRCLQTAMCLAPPVRASHSCATGGARARVGRTRWARFATPCTTRRGSIPAHRGVGRLNPGLSTARYASTFVLALMCRSL
jgi:hypothetical protein